MKYMKTGVASLLLLACPAAVAKPAQDDLKVSVAPFQFGKKAPMKQYRELELRHSTT